MCFLPLFINTLHDDDGVVLVPWILNKHLKKKKNEEGERKKEKGEMRKIQFHLIDVDDKKITL